MTGQALWYLSRASGVTASVLFTTVLVLGVAVAGQAAAEPRGAAILASLHRLLGLGSLVFLGVHVTTAVADSYVPVRIWDVLIPFISDYEPWWVGLGTLALDLIVAITITSLVRHRIPERAWRLVHGAAYLCWPLAMAHAIALGTPDHPGLLAISVGCLATGGIATAWRLLHETADRRRRLLVAEQEWA